MSSSSSSTVSHFGRRSNHKSKGCCAKGNWSGINIAAMVIGFVLFWPVGLVVLYWNISGRDIRDLPSAVQEKWSAFKKENVNEGSHSGNSVFNEFQQTQYDRIHEIKEEIKSRTHSFSDFRSDAKRRKDEAEFDSFMSSDQTKKEK
jgi:hypothetical protein